MAENLCNRVAEEMRARRRQLLAQPLDRLWEELATIAIETIDRERRAEAARNCKHPRMTGSGVVNYTGGSYMTWRCPDCGASGENRALPGKPLSGEAG